MSTLKFSLLVLLLSPLALHGAAFADCISGNCENGFGKYSYEDGGKYEGGFKEGLRYGQGSYTWSDGSRYIGTWERGQQNGQGSLYNSEGNVQFAGTWNRGQQVTMSANSFISARPACLTDHC